MNKPNIILLAVDTLRADHLSCYGYSRRTSPSVEYWLAEKGVVFENHFTQMSYTHPSYSTILSGHYPLTHRSVTMPAKVPPPPGIRMMAEVLGETGYYTAAVSNLPEGRAFYGRGFNLVLKYPQPVQLSAEKITKAPSNYLKHSSMRNINKASIPLLKEISRRQPFLLFLHVWDPHRPYLPFGRFKEIFLTGKEPKNINWSVVIATSSPRETHVEPFDIDYTVAQYDGTIVDFDDAFNAFMSIVEDLGILNKTLIILTADHGESLGEHRIYFRHAGIYDTTMHVPLIIRYPEIFPENNRREELTEHVDIMPTVRTIAGLEGDKDLPGINLLDMISGKSTKTRKAAFAHTNNPDLRYAVRTNNYKLIKHIEGCPKDISLPEEELYDLVKDPAETRNVVNEKPEIADELRSYLESWISETLKKAKHPNPIIEQCGGKEAIRRWPVW